MLVRVKIEDAEVVTLYPSSIIQRVRKWKKDCVSMSESYQEETLPIVSTLSGGDTVRYFTFHCTRFIFHNGDFVTFQPKLGTTGAEICKSESLTTEQAQHRLVQMGENNIPYTIDSLGSALETEFATYFYLYQLIIYAVWLWWGYLFCAWLMLVIVFVAAFSNIFINYLNQKMIQGLTKFSAKIDVMRDAKWIIIDSNLLVPGDLIKVKSDWVVPCDMVLLKGACICDENGLTGESKPVQKIPLPSTDKTFDVHEGMKHTLFAGTKVKQAGRSKNSEVLAVAIETGTRTSKGELVTHILYPRNMSFKYDEELAVALGMLFCYAFVAFLLVIMCLSINGSQKKWIDYFCYGCFTISQVLSPLIPISLVVGQTMASKRLRACGVFCVNPKRIPACGKVRLFAFDKTGTLTKEGLDFIGVHEVETADGEKKFGSRPLVAVQDISPIITKGLATCHALSKFGETLVGNEVEVNMFEATEWSLIEEDGKPTRVKSADGIELEIVKKFEFDHTRMTMSVIVRSLQDQEVYVFCKGSAENIGARSEEKSLPVDYDHISKKHALEGCYVISLGYRKLGKLDDDAIQNMSRDDTEQQLESLGLILFRNEIKDSTEEAIRLIKAGCVRTIMITGDNAQCGWYIARKSKMIKETAKVLLADIASDGKTVEWREMTTTSSPEGPFTTDEILNGHEEAELATTGNAFNVLDEQNHLPALILRLRILARMSPEGKVLTIEQLIAKGLITGMCGDGGNDCGALRTAHVGIALSDAEASVVSPFTSKTKKVTSVHDLLREGRCALVTSFAGYKFLITYGQIFSVVKLCCLGMGVILCNLDYLMFDAIIVMSMTYCMTLTKPLEQLPPHRPTSSLLGPITAGSIIGMQIIHMTMLGIAMGVTINHPGYILWPAEYSEGGAWWYLSDNWECSVFFIMFAGQFLNSGMTFSFGGQFREPIYKNWGLCLTWFAGYLVLTLVYFMPDTSFTQKFHMSSHWDNGPATDNPVWQNYQLDGGITTPPMPLDLRATLWALMTIGSLLSAVYIKYVVEGPIAKKIAAKYPSDRPVFSTGY